MKARNARRKRTKAEIKADREQQRLTLINSPPDDKPLTEDDEEFFAEFCSRYDASVVDSYRQLGCYAASKYDPGYCPRIGLIKR